jgi:DNA polymerase-3 subunit delta'
MRDVRRDAVLRPTMGRRKLYLIPDADRMNAEAANTLLKTLEEPGGFVTLILIAPGVESVLPTIQSRCQIVRFGLTRPEVIATALQERFAMGEEEALSLAHAAGGRVGLALAWAADGSVREQREQVLALLREAEEHRRAVPARPGRQVASLRLAEALRAMAPGGAGATASARVALGQLLDLARDYYRDQLLVAVGAPGGDLDPLLRAIDTVSESQQFLERNVAPQLVLERMFARLIGDPVEPGEGA